MGATSALVFRNLDCLSLFAFKANTTLLAFKTLLFLFFPKSALLNWECGLSTDAAYTWTFTVIEMPIKGKLFENFFFQFTRSPLRGNVKQCTTR